MPDTPGNDLTPTERAETLADTRGATIANTARAIAYGLEGMLGKGGMGEVWSAKDERLGREVALKRMRMTAPNKDELNRFLREAKIQARLDHPAIVPVYELGTDEGGFPYFTMKKLVGTTLAQVLEKREATLQRLLRAMVDVCLAIDLAHAKRVVHRDLKPSNIMLGDYGEVYVLDWGVARLLDEHETEHTASRTSSPEQTKTGQMLGTPGYMAPEQVRAETIGPAADVYALGSILFEILAGESLHPRGSAALATTVDKPQMSPASRVPSRQIPPELDEICVEALAGDPSARPTARELGDRIQQYLDGDRDLEQRRVLAAKLVVQGRASLEAGERADAVQLGGRALALDPNNEEAAGLVMSLLTSVPKETPAELQKLLDDQDRQGLRLRSRRALVPVLAFFLLSPFLSLLVITSWAPLIAVYATAIVLGIIGFVNWRIRPVPFVLWAACNLTMCVVFTRLSGPFVLTPVIVCAVLLSAGAQPWIADRRWALVVMAAIAILTPFVLEELGVFAPSWSISGQGVLSHGTVFLPGYGSVWPLFVANFMVIVLVSMFALAITRDRRAAQRALITQTWQLRHLLPRQATERTMAA